MKKKIIRLLLCAGLILGNVVTTAGATVLQAADYSYATGILNTDSGSQNDGTEDNSGSGGNSSGSSSNNSGSSSDNNSGSNSGTNSGNNSGSNSGTNSSGNTNSGSSNDSSDSESTDLSEMTQGADKDIAFSGYSVSGNQAGQKVTVNFSVTVNPYASSNYTIAGLKRVFANVDDSFPFETTDEACKVVSVTGNTANISYSFVAKDNLETGYYPISFTIVYDRTKKVKVNNVDTFILNTDTEFYVTRKYSVKINAKPVVKKTEKKEAEAADTDVTIEVKNTADGIYGKKCNVNFVAKSNSCKITNVAPVIGDNFPFETNGDAYKNVKSAGTNSLKCNYNFTVRSDVSTGYQSVGFAITYIKDGKTFSATKTMNVYLEGKKEKKKDSSGSGSGKSSTPRLMVTGCETNVEQIFPNDIFELTVHMKNTAKKAVSNIKVTLASDDKSFVSTNGASSAFVESIPAGGTADVKFELQADSALSAKAYGVSIKTEYEDSSANAYTSEDALTIPVNLKSNMKISDIQVPYDLSVGGEGTLSFTITNTGAGSLYNVSVNCKSDDFTCEDSYVGNITAGNAGYATITLTGSKVTEGDGACEISVTYEDNKGNKTTVTEPTNIFVSDMSDAVDDTENMEEVEPEKKAVVWPYVVGAIVVVVVIILVIRRNKKKRKQAEEELMDDDI